MGALVIAMHKDSERKDKFYVLTGEGFQINNAMPQENLTMDDVRLLIQELKKNDPRLITEFIM